MAGVVPEQVVGPAPRFAQGVHVAAAEEVGLHIHLLDRQFAGLDLLVHPLMARIEAAGVSSHGDQARALGDIRQPFSVGQTVGHRDLHLHMLAGLQALNRLAGVHVGGGGEDGRLDARLFQRLAQVGGPVRDSVLLGHLAGRIRRAAGKLRQQHKTDHHQQQRTDQKLGDGVDRP